MDGYTSPESAALRRLSPRKDLPDRDHWEVRSQSGSGRRTCIQNGGRAVRTAPRACWVKSKIG